MCYPLENLYFLGARNTDLLCHLMGSLVNSGKYPTGDGTHSLGLLGRCPNLLINTHHSNIFMSPNPTI